MADRTVSHPPPQNTSSGAPGNPGEGPDFNMVAAGVNQPQNTPKTTGDTEYMSPEWKATRRQELTEEQRSRTELAAAGGKLTVLAEENPFAEPDTQGDPELQLEQADTSLLQIQIPMTRPPTSNAIATADPALTTTMQPPHVHRPTTMEAGNSETLQADWRQLRRQQMESESASKAALAAQLPNKTIHRQPLEPGPNTYGSRDWLDDPGSSR